MSEQRDHPAGEQRTLADAGAPDGAEEAAARLRLYTYLQVPERRTYLAIMRLFTSTLLADLSASEVSAALRRVEQDGLIDAGESDVDIVLTRLRKLVEWGNLVLGRRETIAASIAEFQTGSMRYQVSKLAVRVQRDVDELLRVPEGAREVSRELLPAVQRGLRTLGETLSTALRTESAEPGSRAARRARESLAEQVTTLFLQHAQLAATVRDFYAYLGQVLTRHHLAPDEISGFRNLLVEYIQLVVEDVLRYTPSVAEVLSGRLASARPELLRLLGHSEDRLGSAVERARGRSDADWQELTDWFVDRPGSPSQVTALREATARAIGSLLATVKRATSGGGLLPSRRGELLKLAGWFDAADAADAHRIYASAFGLYSARNLTPAPEHDGDDEHTPWRDGPAIDVLVSVRTRGDRGARGRTSRIVEDPMTEQTLLAEARRADEHRGAAARELAAAQDFGDVTLSAGALDALCELLTLAMAQREGTEDDGEAVDPVRGLRLTINPDPGHHTTIRTTDGTLTVRNAAVNVTANAAPNGGGR